MKSRTTPAETSATEGSLCRRITDRLNLVTVETEGILREILREIEFDLTRFARSKVYGAVTEVTKDRGKNGETLTKPCRYSLQTVFEIVQEIPPDRSKHKGKLRLSANITVGDRQIYISHQNKTEITEAIERQRIRHAQKVGQLKLLWRRSCHLQKHIEDANPHKINQILEDLLRLR